MNDTPPKPALRATSRSLPIAMLRARENLMSPLRLMLGKGGVTEQQWRVLRVLGEGGEMDPKDIARQACLLNPSLTRIMQILDKKGLITRAPHPTDRRRVLVSITGKGTALIDRLTPESNRIFADLETKYGRERMDELLDLLNALSDVEI
ncbi:MAG: homoprotocatechuate degradation operon regulator HpaR [Rhodobacterales bacterium]|nr:homoprotocatechuate degradation operon regulator HpaR [Rhodobacterales bacterium]